MAPYPVSGTPAQGIPAMAPDVVNNSWGCPPSEGCDLEHVSFLNQVVDNVRAAGIMVVASAGNRGSACGTVNEPPGMYDATYTVGASNTLDSIAGFSSRGTGTGLIKPDIVAPGVSVLSSVPGTGYAISSGYFDGKPACGGRDCPFMVSTSRPSRTNSNLRKIFSTNLLFHVTARNAVMLHWLYPTTFTGGDGSMLTLLCNQVLCPVVFVSRQVRISVVSSVVAELNPGVTWKTISDAQGFYTLYPMTGTYTVTVSKSAYVSQVFTDVVVTSAQTTTLAVTLTQQCVPLMNVSFMSTPQFPQTDRPALFTGSVVTGSTPITFTWNYGDGTAIQAGNPISHVFIVSPPDYAQTYQGVLTVTNACSSDDTRQWITVHTVFSFLPNVLRGP